MSGFLPAMGGWSDRWLEHAWAGFWQSSLLIAVVWLADLALRRWVRPVVRHALWLLVLVKLVLPASLALPTGLGYWIPRGAAVSTEVMEGTWAVREVSGSRDGVGVPVLALEPAPVTRVAWRLPDLALIAWLVGAAGLLGLVAWHTLRLRRWREGTSGMPVRLARVLEEVRAEVGLRHPVEVRWIAEGLSPALCGFWRPVLLLPRGLAGRLSDERLRAVVLHELVHARRGDVWVNALQVGLQVLWWWHPLVWLANARLRAVREEVVDDEVAFRMGPEGMAYPEALLEVARATVLRPASGLGFLGIVESRSALRARVERLLEDPPTRMPRLGWGGGVAVLLLGLLLVPMARGRSAAAERPIEPVLPVGVVTAVEVTPKATDPGSVTPRPPDAGMGLPAGARIVPRRQVDPWTGRILERERVAGGAPQVSNSLWDLGDQGTTFEYGTASEVRVETAALVTRTYRLNYAVMIPALEKRLGRPLGEEFGVWVAAFREAFDGVGLTFAPPSAMHMNHRAGMLMIRAPAGDVDKVDDLLTELGTPPPVLMIEARFLELTEEAFRSLPLAGGPAADGVAVDAERVRVLTEAQRRALLEAVSRRSDVRMLGAPRLTTLSGREAEIRQSGTGTNAANSVMAAVRPKLLENQWAIRMVTRVEWTQEAPDWILKAGALPGGGGAAEGSADGSGATVVPVVQGYINRSFTNTVVVGDGQAQVLGDLGREALPFGMKRVLVVLQPIWIDAAGNRVNNPVTE